MEDQCSPLSWAYYYQKEGVDELKQSLLYSTLELESALVSAYEDISRKDDEILQLKTLLAEIVKERDEFNSKCQDLALEKRLIFQQKQILANASRNRLDSCPISSSDEDDQSDCSDSINNVLTAASPLGCKDTLAPVLGVKRPLPEKGRLLQAVMEAGPLLQNLLLAGPLPRWQHPPPRLSPVEIPPVTISSPRVLTRDFSPSPKYKKRVRSPNVAVSAPIE